MKPLKDCVSRILAAAVFALTSVSASAIPFGTPVGPIGGPVYSEGFNLLGDVLGRPGWVIGSPSVPNGLLADPLSGPWRKYLYTDATGNPFHISQGFTFNIVEVLWAVNSWDSWREGIVTDGWEWVPNSGALMTAASFQDALDNHTAPVLVSGLVVDRSVNGKLLNFEFDPLVTTSASDTLVVFKSIACVAVAGCTLGSSVGDAIEVLEYPTAAVPEPATLLLMGAGLIAMGLRRPSK